HEVLARVEACGGEAEREREQEREQPERRGDHRVEWAFRLVLGFGAAAVAEDVADLDGDQHEPDRDDEQHPQRNGIERAGAGHGASPDVYTSYPKSIRA